MADIRVTGRKAEPSQGPSDIRVTNKAGGGQQTRTSQILGAYKGFTTALQNAGAKAEAAYRATPWGDELDALRVRSGSPDVAQARKDQEAYLRRKEAEGVRPGKVGEIAGFVGAAAPLAALSRNPYVLGGLQGGLFSEKETLPGILGDTGWGALLGKAGDYWAGQLGHAASPYVRRAAESAAKIIPGGVKNAASQLIEPFRQKLPPPRLSGTPEEKAGQQYVIDKAREKGLQSAADVSARAEKEFASHPEARGAELMGKEGEGILQAVTRQGGTSGDAATAAARRPVPGNSRHHATA